MNIDKLIENNLVYFEKYHNGAIYYGIDFEDNTYIFPIFLEDIGKDTTLEIVDRAMYYTKYIHRAIKEYTLVLK